MLANLLGINQANFDYFCLWCDCYKPEQNLDMTVEDWRITGRYDQCREGCTMRRKEDARGCKFCPLIKLDFTKVIPDTLHLHQRVGSAISHGVIELGREQWQERWTIDCISRLVLPPELHWTSRKRSRTVEQAGSRNIKRILQAINLD